MRLAHFETGFPFSLSCLSQKEETLRLGTLIIGIFHI